MNWHIYALLNKEVKLGISWCTNYSNVMINELKMLGKGFLRWNQVHNWDIACINDCI